MANKIKTWKFKQSQKDVEMRVWVKGLLRKPRLHDDERRRGIFDVFSTPSGDINYSYIYPNSMVAWHRHAKQTDYWYVIKGSLKVGLYDETKKRLCFVYLHEYERVTLAIPPGVWHGYKNIGGTEAILSYYITQKFDETNPDEERAPVGAFGDNWEFEIK